jgi:hypothetical protein
MNGFDALFNESGIQSYSNISDYYRIITGNQDEKEENIPHLDDTVMRLAISSGMKEGLALRAGMESILKLKL